MDEYKNFWLDESSMYGEILWCRLNKVNQGDESSGSKLNAATPVAICLRENIPWLLNPSRQKEIPDLRSDAARVYGILQKSGALFTDEIRITSNSSLPRSMIFCGNWQEKD